MRNLSRFPHHRRPTGSSHLHQTAGEIQRETQALHGVCMLLLHSDGDRKTDRRRRWEREDFKQRTPECVLAFALHL